MAAFRERLRTPAAAGIIATIILAIVAVSVRATGLFEPLELAAFDRLSALSLLPPSSIARAALVTVSEDDIATLGWPLSDEILANALERLHAAGPSGIAVDIFRPTPVPPGSQALDAALRDIPEIIWADRFGEGAWQGLSAPAAARNAGFSDVILDPGGVARRALLYLDDGKRVSTGLPVRLALRYLRQHRVAPHPDAGGDLVLGTVPLHPLSADPGGYQSMNAGGYQILRRFAPPSALRTIPFSDLLAGRVSAETIAGRMVVLGTVADSVKDYVQAPIELSGPVTMSGAALHAQFAAQLVAHGLDGLAPIRTLPRRGETAAIVLVIALGGAAGLVASRLIWLVIAAGVGAGAIGWACILAFRAGLWLPAALLAGGWLVACVAARAAASQTEHSQRLTLMRLFATHISGPIAAEMWRRRAEFTRLGRPLPVKLEATVLFSDINDFTTASEDMAPEEIVRWLDPYMRAVTELIAAHGGVVERFSGDGVLAMFGVPVPRHELSAIATDARAAVACALAMREALFALNDDYRETGQPPMRVAIGIQSGPMVGCSLGGPGRLQYTTMGDTTNTAARLVGVAKDVMKSPEAGFPVADPCCIVVGEATRALTGAEPPARALGEVALKGKHRRAGCVALLPTTAVAE